MTSNRRAFFRLPISQPVRYRTLVQDGHSEWLDGLLEDLSAAGMRMASAAITDLDTDALLCGDLRLEVELVLPSAQDTLKLPATVVWLEQEADETPKAGMQFAVLDAELSRAVDDLVLEHCRAAACREIDGSLQ